LASAVLEHYEYVLRLCFVLAKSPQVARDLAQETFVRAAPHLGSVRADAARAYLRATAVNLSRSWLRRRLIEAGAQIRAREISTVWPDSSVEDRDLLWRALAALSPTQRSCVVLRFYEDLTARETAEVLGCSVGAVKKHLSRAMSGLRRALEEVPDEGRVDR
jgi:RNA polymerase sigma factor (sigma-70 family)